MHGRWTRIAAPFSLRSRAKVDMVKRHAQQLMDSVLKNPDITADVSNIPDRGSRLPPRQAASSCLPRV